MIRQNKQKCVNNAYSTVKVEDNKRSYFQNIKNNKKLREIIEKRRYNKIDTSKTSQTNGIKKNKVSNYTLYSKSKNPQIRKEKSDYSKNDEIIGKLDLVLYL